jgi:hypothetical protein
MNTWTIAATSKDCGGGSSLSAAARNAEEVLLRPLLLRQLRVDLRLVCLGDFVSLTRSCSEPPPPLRHCLLLLHVRPRCLMRCYACQRSGHRCRHNAIVLGIRLNKCNSSYQLAAGGPCSANSPVQLSGATQTELRHQRMQHR